MCWHITCSPRCGRAFRELRYFPIEPERKPPGGCGASTRPRKAIERQSIDPPIGLVRTVPNRPVPSVGAIPDCDCWVGIGLRSCPVFDRVSGIGQHLDHDDSGVGRLLLATLVGLTTVPYLARQVLAARVRDAMDYEVTRAGMVYMGITLVIGVASINTGNNLLYIVVAALLSAILVSGIASAIVLRHLELDVHLPEHVFAGRPMLARLLLQNLSGWLPSFSIRVVPSKRKPVKRWHWEAYTLGLPRNRPPESQWFRVPDRRLRRVVENPDKQIGRAQSE